VNAQTPLSQDWSPADLDLIVGDYFVMLAKDLAGQVVDLAAHQRALRFVTGRSGGALEFKTCEISAVVSLVGLPILTAFAPRWTYAEAVVEAVERQLIARPALFAAAARPASLFAPQGFALPVESPPPVFDPRQVEPGPAAGRLIARFDPAVRDAADRFLVETGLAAVLALEQHRLRHHGRPDLAARVRPTGAGDAAGCDLLSPATDGSVQRIAVKTTTGGPATPFALTDAEQALWTDRPDVFRLYRLYDLGRDLRFYRLRPPQTA
jgi:hypothetical protein